jgi:hypothetical protein
MKWKEHTVVKKPVDDIQRAFNYKWLVDAYILFNILSLVVLDKTLLRK